ncbi:MAG: ATP-binding protein [Bacteroidota bacterium]|nr:ATP-binding protein [Bacteroidota bacterium]
METSEEKTLKNNKIYHLYRRFLRFHSSIFGRVIYIISILSVILFLSFGLIFRSVYEDYLNTVIRQNGNNIGSIVEGALYHSMLKNDKSALQSTLDIINTMPGIDEVNMYDNRDSLAYSTIAFETRDQVSPNCKNCHNDIKSMFPGEEKSHRIIDEKSACRMTASGEGHRQLLIRSPIYNEISCYTAACHYHQPQEKLLGSLIIKVPLQQLDMAVIKSSRDFFLLAAITTLLLVVFLVIFTRKKINNPLKAIISASEAVARGNKSTRLEIKPGLLYDMRMVSLAFNNMLDNLNMANKELENWSQQLEYKIQKKSEELSSIQNELIHVERIASLGKLSSSVAHEINNPLSGVLTYTKLIHKQLDKIDFEGRSKESMLKYLTIIESETKRCGDIVKGLLDFSKKEQKNFQVCHLHKLLKDTYNLMAHQMKMSEIYFYTDFKAEADLVNCSENQIKQACVAMLVNSSEAIRENGEVIIRTSNPDPGHIRMDIADNGVGIAEDDQQHIFEPFFSAKQKVSGIGLGLAIVHGIVQNHKGKIEIDSKPGKGTTMSITFPLANNKEPKDDKENFITDR